MRAWIAAALILMPTGVAGQTVDYYTVGGLEKACRSVDRATEEALPNLETGYCIGFIQGARGMMDIMNLRAPSNTCIPAKVTDEDIRLVFLAWVEQHPEIHDRSTLVGLTAALREAYPCRARDS